MDNSINFKGAFIFHQPNKTVQKGILPLLGKHHQIFENFVSKGDTLYVTRKGRDRDIAEFLTQHRANFKFYPELSTKSGFDDEQADVAYEIITKSNIKPLTKRSELKDLFQFGKLDVKKLFSAKRKYNPIENSLSALGYSKQEQVIKQRNGYTEVKDKNGKMLARISGPGQYGISFAYVEPKNADEAPHRYALHGKEIIFQYKSESGRIQFLKNYNSAVKANKVPIKK